jgi:hypothetical protein
MALRFSLVLGLLAVAGCQAPWIKFPTLYPSDPAAERASFAKHDLLPDSSMGPETNARPRDGWTQRSEPRRALEAYPAPSSSVYSPIGPSPAGVPPPPSVNYPNSVAP